MSWSGGEYTLPLAPVISGTPVLASWANTSTLDLAGGISFCLPRDGSAPMLAPFPNFDGVLLAPGITFGDELTTGWWRDAGTPGEVNFAALGKAVTRVRTTGNPDYEPVEEIWNPFDNGGAGGWRQQLNSWNDFGIEGEWTFSAVIAGTDIVITGLTATDSLLTGIPYDPAVPIPATIKVINSEVTRQEGEVRMVTIRNDDYIATPEDDRRSPVVFRNDQAGSDDYAWSLGFGESYVPGYPSNSANTSLELNHLTDLGAFDYTTMRFPEGATALRFPSGGEVQVGGNLSFSNTFYDGRTDDTLQGPLLSWDNYAQTATFSISMNPSTDPDPEHLTFRRDGVSIMEFWDTSVIQMRNAVQFDTFAIFLANCTMTSFTTSSACTFNGGALFKDYARVRDSAADDKDLAYLRPTFQGVAVNTTVDDDEVNRVLNITAAADIDLDIATAGNWMQFFCSFSGVVTVTKGTITNLYLMTVLGKTAVTSIDVGEGAVFTAYWSAAGDVYVYGSGVSET